MESVELYFHIPFCVRKCLYCDFLSFGDGRSRQDYVRALAQETEMHAEECRKMTVSSVFFGGGTPSLLEPRELEPVFAALRAGFRLAEDCEITVECNPGTVTGEKLDFYREMGVNRLSIGLQSGLDEELRRIGRIHSKEQFLETWEAAAAAGFTNCNLDIMSALPGQTAEDYRKTLELVGSLDPAPVHVSAYSLILEEGTPLYDLVQRGALTLPGEDADREMYEETGRFLGEMGLRRYEVSNYAVPGYECRHNLGYWTGVPYLGLGLGASSYFGGCRYRHTEDMAAYLADPAGTRLEEQILTKNERMSERMILGLRLTRGICAEDFAEEFGTGLREAYGETIARHEKEGLLITEKDENGRSFLRFTEKGMDLENYVLRDFV
ncbi:MAG: radical SAM family heme chaperone HemW [Lachnospiraceae bacterium]|nr:radical SAM family heme chaperone HemW [Lachnospiraceae bacterium]